MKRFSVAFTALFLTVGCTHYNTVPYPSEVKQNFVAACTQKGSTEQRCTCMFNAIQSRFDIAEYMQIESTVVKGGQPPKAFFDAVSSCLR